MGYRPRTGTVFFTRNGKKLEDVAHGLKSQNLFPTVGANGPCTVHANFGQMGFVYIEANVKKWGLAPMTGSLAPPPPYGSEQGSILLEAGREGFQNSQGRAAGAWNSRSNAANARSRPPTSPGPVRSPTDISLAQLSHIPSNDNAGEGNSGGVDDNVPTQTYGLAISHHDHVPPPPKYTSPDSSEAGSPRGSMDSERRPILRSGSPRPPIPTYDAAVADDTNRRRRDDDDERTSRMV